MASGRMDAGVIRSLVNAKDLQFECARGLHEILIVPVIMYGSGKMLWKEKERSRVRGVQMYNLRGLLGIRRMNRVQNSQTRELCGVRKGLDEIIDKCVLLWLGHAKRVERDRITKRVYAEECAGSHSVGRSWKRGIGTVKECLKKR